jgi:outer membrane protein OmpA-like peptidoglycan-associated protein
MPERCDIDINVSVTDQNTKAAISGATVQLIDKTTGKVLEEKTNTSGNSFNFVLVQGKEYELATKKEGWESDKNVSVDTRKTALTAKFGSTENPMTLSESTFLKETGLIVETYNKKTGEPLSGVNVTVMGMANETLKENTSQSNKHEFKIPRTNDVKIRARLQGYVGETKTVAKSDLKNVQKLYLTPPPIFINVYFDFDKFNIRQGAVDTLDKIFTILNENLDMVVEVRGHTDSKGTNEYNETLAVNRSNASIDYLVKKGIDKSRLISKGFGENEPVAPNEDPTGKDDPAGRQLNRRVEFKVIKGEGATSNNESNTQVTTETEKKNQVTIVKAK